MLNMLKIEKKLNILKLKLKKTYKKKSLNNKSITIRNKEFVPAVRDWKNSIYVYNKNSLSLIPVASRLVMKLIKGYFSSYNLRVEKKVRKVRIRRRFRKLSTNKIFISDGEFKHTNDKVNITLYVYNRQRLNYFLILKKRYLKIFKRGSFKRKLQIIKNEALSVAGDDKEISKRFINVLPNIYIGRLYSIQAVYFVAVIEKLFNKLIYSIYFKQLLYINKAKFENSYLQGLIDLIRKIYKKNVEFNIINLKYFYLNSDIFAQPLVLKLRRKRKLSKYLNRLISKPLIKKIKLNGRRRDFFERKNFFTINENELDTTNNILYELMQDNITKSRQSLKNVVLNDINYKRVSGVRLEGAGRLTKRYTASRSQHKVKYNGNLRNTYSTIKSYPSSVIRGNFKANLGYTKLNSKTRIGSFGIKGWVSGT